MSEDLVMFPNERVESMLYASLLGWRSLLGPEPTLSAADCHKLAHRLSLALERSGWCFDALQNGEVVAFPASAEIG